jgi:TIR domain
MDTGVYFATHSEKSQRARERGYIQVFLSHKHKDVGAAEVLQEILEINGGQRVKVFMSENISKGDAWQEGIEKQLYESDWFLMIFTGVDNEDWSWCHHEAGIFRGMMYPDAKRVVVLYPPNVSLPDPLKKYQSVACHHEQQEDIHRFFDDFFGKEPYPEFGSINPRFANKDSTSRRDDTQRIIDAVGRLVVKSITPENAMIIHVPNKKDLMEQNRFPADTQIIGGSGGVRLFDLGDSGDFLWSEFQDALDDEFRTCLDRSFWPAVYQACAKSIRARRLASTHTVLRSPRDGHHYMPMLSRAEITGSNSATFHITFVQVAAGTQSDVRDKSVARIFTSLNLAHRFRWEIIDPYRDLPRLQAFVEHASGSRATGANGHDGLTAIWEAIGLIETEAQTRGVQDEEALPGDFGPGAAEEVRAMFPLWRIKRQQLQDAVHDHDVVGFARILNELDAVNVRFISLAAQRLSELVRAGANPVAS